MVSPPCLEVVFLPLKEGGEHFIRIPRVAGQRRKEALENPQVSPEPDQFWISQVISGLGKTSELFNFDYL